MIWYVWLLLPPSSRNLVVQGNWLHQGFNIVDFWNVASLTIIFELLYLVHFLSVWFQFSETENKLLANVVVCTVTYGTRKGGGKWITNNWIWFEEVDDRQLSEQDVILRNISYSWSDFGMSSYLFFATRVVFFIVCLRVRTARNNIMAVKCDQGRSRDL